MVFTLVLRPQAQNEYEDSFLWYLGRSNSAAEDFNNRLEHTFDLL